MNCIDTMNESDEFMRPSSKALRHWTSESKSEVSRALQLIDRPRPGRKFNRGGEEEEKHYRAATWPLFVGHHKYAVPICGRFSGDILLTALQVNTRRPVLRPLVQDFLERALRGLPLPIAKEIAGAGEHFHL